MSTCKGCGAKILFIETKAGRFMPCDPEPLAWDDLEEGMVVVGQNGEVLTVKGILVEDDGMNWYVSHFATCPKADDFRKTK